MTRSTSAAGTRAAQAALTPAQDSDFDRYLLVDDTDDVTTEIAIFMRERCPREGEVRS
jgi:hypothetical protein